MFVKLSVQSVIIRGCGNKTPPTVCLYVIIPILWWNISAVLLPRTRLPVHSFCNPPPCLSRTGYFQVDFLVLKSVSIDKSNPRCKQKCFARRLRFIFSSVAEEFLTLRNLNLAYCRKIIHKWHKINTKYNKPFMIKEIIDGSVRPLGWRTFIHRRYDAVHDFCFVWPIHQTISIIFLIENLVGKHDSTYSMYFLAIWKLLSHNLSQYGIML